MKRLSAILGTIGCFLVLAAPVQAQSGGTVQEIVVEGVQRIEPETVKSYMVIHEGDPLNSERVNRSLKALFATGLFADVNIQGRGNRLFVNVVENPIINRVAFEGNKKLEDDDLNGEITLKPRVIYTRTKVQNDVKRILTLYRRSGRFAATVEPKVIRKKDNRIDLVFEINEGPVTEISAIRFVGNKVYDDGELKEVIKTKETRWYRFFTTDDNYDPDRIAFDREMLRRFYLNEGFADFRVVSAVAELTPDKQTFFVTYSVEEGPRYKVNALDYIVSLRKLEVADLKDGVEIETGDWYSAEAIDEAIDSLTDIVGNKGYAFVDVRPRTNRNREKGEIDVTFEVGEGPRVFVERIEIRGNSRTEDQVVRREFRLVEGDAFNTAKLRRSRQRIEGLGFFEKVNVEQIPGSAPDKTIVAVEVQEQSTGSLSFGAGYSTTNGPLVDIGISERNLLGKGQRLNLSGVLAAKKSQINLSFTEPYFLDREVSAGFDVFKTTNDYQDVASYDSAETGFSLRTGYPITDHLRENWGYTIKQTTIENVDSSASTGIKEQEGDTLLSEVSHALVLSDLDSPQKPTEGYRVHLSNAIAGLGGDEKYFKNVLKGVNYYPITDKMVFSLRGELGHIIGIGDDVSISNRFFLGGDDLRGFANYGVGPRDTSTEDALGGEWKYLASAQVTFPLGFPSEFDISGKLFVDLGSAGELTTTSTTVSDTGSLRASFGTGIAWVSPMGPIGVDVGYPIKKESFDIEETIRVNFGTRF